tara:strand:+ start:5109 stop:5516 length:408 start_codon:yes stop_codon:yes gene_type:complete
LSEETPLNLSSHENTFLPCSLFSVHEPVFTGCAVINSHSETRTSGTHVSESTLDQVEVGRTTAEWVVATLGHPASEREIEGGRLLKYSSRQFTKINSELLFVIDTSSRKEVSRTVFFEFHAGVLSRFWVEENESS